MCPPGGCGGNRLAAATSRRRRQGKGGGVTLVGSGCATGRAPCRRRQCPPPSPLRRGMGWAAGGAKAAGEAVRRRRSRRQDEGARGRGRMRPSQVSQVSLSAAGSRTGCQPARVPVHDPGCGARGAARYLYHPCSLGPPGAASRLAAFGLSWSQAPERQAVPGTRALLTLGVPPPPPPT